MAAHIVSMRFSSFFASIVKRSSEKCLLPYKFRSNSRLNSRCYHLTRNMCDLMEFFDDRENWIKNDIKSGRSWKLEELRIKSNSDLHKLWYVLLKEKNMLLTMEAEYKRLQEPMPSPERIDKVEESMERLAEVVEERDRAVNLLETGRTGQPEHRIVHDPLGNPEVRTAEEHVVPEHLNKAHQLMSQVSREAEQFQVLKAEQYDGLVERARAHVRSRRAKLRRNFPDATEDEIEEFIERTSPHSDALLDPNSS